MESNYQNTKDFVDSSNSKLPKNATKEFKVFQLPRFVVVYVDKGKEYTPEELLTIYNEQTIGGLTKS